MCTAGLGSGHVAGAGCRRDQAASALAFFFGLVLVLGALCVFCIAVSAGPADVASGEFVALALSNECHRLSRTHASRTEGNSDDRVCTPSQSVAFLPPFFTPSTEAANHPGIGKPDDQRSLKHT